ncbi:MAG: hypothetical protein QOH71_1889 [Blastocatellia bacterium]|jgi:hypothetical protein|nr:hypothetical protein [Blastocatellia bacterium]
MSLLQSSEDLTGSASYKHFAPTELKPRLSAPQLLWHRLQSVIPRSQTQTEVCATKPPPNDAHWAT